MKEWINLLLLLLVNNSENNTLDQNWKTTIKFPLEELFTKTIFSNNEFSHLINASNIFISSLWLVVYDHFKKLENN